MRLDELITTARRGRSYVDLARDTGGKLGAARWQQIANRPLRNFPDPASIVAIAAALQVPEQTVVLAIASTLGLDVDSRATLSDLIPPRANNLPPQCIAAVLQIVDAMLSQEVDGR